MCFACAASGTISSAGQSVSCTFAGNANDVIDYTITATSGTLSPFLELFNSAGKLIRSAANRNANGSCARGPVVEMNTVALPAADTYTLTVADCVGTNTGNYDLYSQSVVDPLGAVNLAFGQTTRGTISSAAQSNTYTDGACAGGTAWEADGIKLSTARTYVALLGDCGDVNTGTSDIYAQRTENASGAKALACGKTLTGSIMEAAPSNTYPFLANNRFSPGRPCLERVSQKEQLWMLGVSLNASPEDGVIVTYDRFFPKPRESETSNAPHSRTGQAISD